MGIQSVVLKASSLLSGRFSVIVFFLWFWGFQGALPHRRTTPVVFLFRALHSPFSSFPFPI